MSSVSESRSRVDAVSELDAELQLLSGQRPSRAHRLPGRVQLAALLAIVSLQVWINYRTGLISDLAKLYFGHRLYTHPLPYIGARIEYPVLTGMFMTGAAALSDSLHSYLAVSSLGLWACAIGCVCALWSRSRRAAWCFGLCPLLLVYSLLNWDLLAILLMVLGWRAWERGQYSRAALWLTLGTFAKFYPVFLLAFCLVELVRRTHNGELQRAVVARFVAVTGGVGLAVNLPFAVLAFHNWLYFWSFSASRDEHADLLSWLGVLNGPDVATANLVLGGIVLIAVAAGVLAAWRGLPTTHVAALVFFIFMEMQKVYSPQYTLWLVAFAVIAGWESWAIGVLSLIGLISYFNASVHIQVVHHGVHMLGWYDNHVGPVITGERLITILIVAGASGYRAALARGRRGLVVAGGVGV